MSTTSEASRQLRRLVAELEAHPPSPVLSEPRFRALAALDRILMDPAQTSQGGAFDVGAASHQPAVNPLRDLYVCQVRKALTEMETAPVKRGLRAWQLYNMGIVVQTPSVMLGFDVVRGLRWHDWGWDVPPDVVDRLARVLDVLLVTHYIDDYHSHPGQRWLHVDHYDEALVAAMQRLNKPVFIPTGHEPYFDHDPRFRYAGHQESHELGGLRITSHGGRHIYQDSPFATPLMLYEIVTRERRRIVFAGDFDYTASDAALGEDPIDLLVLHAGGVSPLYDDQNAHDLGDDDDAFRIGLQRFRARTVIASHLAELSHPPGGGRESYRMAIDIFRQLLGRVPTDLLIMFWGEAIHLE